MVMDSVLGISQSNGRQVSGEHKRVNRGARGHGICALGGRDLPTARKMRRCGRENMKNARALLLALALPIAAPIPEDTGDGKAEREIRNSLTRWVQAANRGDWKEAVKVWAPDLIGWYPGMPDDTYAREIERAARGGAPRTKYELEIKEVMVSGQLAVVRDVWTFTTRQESGRDLTETVRSFEVWRRQPDGAWKICRWISAPEPKQ